MDYIDPRITSSDYLNYFQAVGNVEIFLANKMDGVGVMHDHIFYPVRRSYKELFISFFKQIHLLFSSHARAVKQYETDKKISILAESIKIINECQKNFESYYNDDHEDSLTLAEKRFICLVNSTRSQFQKLNSLTQNSSRISKFIRALFGNSLGDPERIKITRPANYLSFHQYNQFFAALRKEIWKGRMGLSNINYLMNLRNGLDYGVNLLDHWVLLHTLKNQKIPAEEFDSNTQQCYLETTSFDELCDLVNFISTHRKRIIEQDNSPYLTRYEDAVKKMFNFFQSDQKPSVLSVAIKRLHDSVTDEEKTIFKYCFLHYYSQYLCEEMDAAQEGNLLKDALKRYMGRTSVDAEGINGLFQEFVAP